MCFMVRQEAETGLALNPHLYIVGELQFITESLNNKGDSNLRRSSANIKRALSDLHGAWNPGLLEIEEIARATASALNALANDPNATIYNTYARVDILEGLGEAHNNAQLFIIHYLDDPTIEVRNLTRKLLSKSNIEIFPETLNFLFDSKDPEDPRKPDQEKTELALSIVENNNSAGHYQGILDTSVREVLLDILSEKREIRGGKRRAAIIASKLFERIGAKLDNAAIASTGNNDLLETAKKFFMSEVESEAVKLKEKENFQRLTTEIVEKNFSSARITDDISTMTLVLPLEPEAIKILSETFKVSEIGGLDAYRQFRAWASQIARESMQRSVTDDREKIRIAAEQRRIEEAAIAEQKRQARELTLRTQKEGREKRIKAVAEEKRLADIARLTMSSSAAYGDGDVPIV